MSEDGRPQLQAILAELRRVPDILGAAIARRDGLLIAHALAKAIVGTSEMVAAEMGLGLFFQTIVDSQMGKILATGAGEEALLITIVRTDANMGFVLLSVDKAMRAIAEVIDGMPAAREEVDA